MEEKKQKNISSYLDGLKKIKKTRKNGPTILWKDRVLAYGSKFGNFVNTATTPLVQDIWTGPTNYQLQISGPAIITLHRAVEGMINQELSNGNKSSDLELLPLQEDLERFSRVIYRNLGLDPQFFVHVKPFITKKKGE